MLAQPGWASSRAALSARWKRVSLANVLGLTPTVSRNTRRRCRSLTPRSVATAFTLALVSRAAAARASCARAGRLLDAPSPPHRIYNVVDDEAPDFATLFASVGAQPPDGSNAEGGRAFDALAAGA
jgi:hypothetical protein